MSEIQQAKFDDWAIVEVMGHQRYAGYVTTENYGNAVLFRVDVPEQPARERVTLRSGYVDGEWVEAGTTIAEGATSGYSKLIGAGSIYAITPCSEEAARRAVDEIQPRALKVVSLPAIAALSAPGGAPDEGFDDGR
jgi:hypothetical protein